LEYEVDVEEGWSGRVVSRECTSSFFRSLSSIHWLDLMDFYLFLHFFLSMPQKTNKLRLSAPTLSQTATPHTAFPSDVDPSCGLVVHLPVYRKLSA
jgi:hypothetical protein